jgi:ankyrin repeat protein
MAVATENISIVKLLDENGADATIQNEDGACPIDIAITDNLKDIVLYFMS